MIHELKLPELGEGITCATVACWHRGQGDRVVKDDDIVEVVTDKASFVICCDYSGIVDNILIKEGKSVKIGEALAYIKTSES